MRKIIVFNLVSLDGYFSRINGDLDWHNVDDEFNQFAVRETQKFGKILFGRITYKIFEDFWPKALTDPKMSEADHKIAKIIDDIEKIVFSKTLKNVSWKNTKLFHEIDSREIKKLKQTRGRDMVIFGSGTIVQALTNFGLIDEYWLLVNPIVLGRGKQLFPHMKDILKIKLLKTKTFKNGNVLLCYSPRFGNRSSR